MQYSTLILNGHHGIYKTLRASLGARKSEGTVLKALPRRRLGGGPTPRCLARLPLLGVSRRRLQAMVQRLVSPYRFKNHVVGDWRGKNPPLIQFE